jgi:hypothetical protein
MAANVKEEEEIRELTTAMIFRAASLIHLSHVTLLFSPPLFRKFLTLAKPFKINYEILWFVIKKIHALSYRIMLLMMMFDDRVARKNGGLCGDCFLCSSNWCSNGRRISCLKANMHFMVRG